MAMAASKDIKAYIRERCVELSTEEYTELLRELSMWAEDEANMIEYQIDFINEIKEEE